ncbi:MAG: hypothetical protein E2600_09405, partial [Chryseobacterium sp.]|nr:hypothetical protein [Chryseobacterium sp.]
SRLHRATAADDGLVERVHSEGVDGQSLGQRDEYTNTCPTGVATQDKMLIKGLDTNDKTERVYQFHKNTLHTCNELIAAAGRESYDQVDASMFMRGDEFEHLSDTYFPDILENVRKR